MTYIVIVLYRIYFYKWNIILYCIIVNCIYIDFVKNDIIINGNSLLIIY